MLYVCFWSPPCPVHPTPCPTCAIESSGSRPALQASRCGETDKVHTWESLGLGMAMLKGGGSPNQSRGQGILSLEGKGRGEGRRLDIPGKGTHISARPTNSRSHVRGLGLILNKWTLVKGVLQRRDLEGSGIGPAEALAWAILSTGTMPAHWPLLAATLGPQEAPGLGEAGSTRTRVGTQWGQIQAGSPNSCQHPAIMKSWWVIRGSSGAVTGS